MEKVQREIENYRHFVKLTRELVEINEKISQMRPVPEIEEEGDLEALKKTLSRQFARRSKKKSSVP